MNEKELTKNTPSRTNFRLLILAVVIPALTGSIWLISTLLIAVGLRKTSSQPLSVFFLSFFGIYLQAALVGILTPLLLKKEAKKIFTVFFSTLISEALALGGFFGFLKIYYGNWFLPVISLTEPLNDSFFLIGISTVISLIYYWFFVFPSPPASESVEEKTALKE